MTSTQKRAQTSNLELKRTNSLTLKQATWHRDKHTHRPTDTQAVITYTLRILNTSADEVTGKAATELSCCTLVYVAHWSISHLNKLYEIRHANARYQRSIMWMSDDEPSIYDIVHDLERTRAHAFT